VYTCIMVCCVRLNCALSIQCTRCSFPVATVANTDTTGICPTENYHCDSRKSVNSAFLFKKSDVILEVDQACVNTTLQQIYLYTIATDFCSVKYGINRRAFRVTNNKCQRDYSYD